MTDSDTNHSHAITALECSKHQYSKLETKIENVTDRIEICISLNLIPDHSELKQAEPCDCMICKLYENYIPQNSI